MNVGARVLHSEDMRRDLAALTHAGKVQVHLPFSCCNLMFG